ncbi:hypothetical protein [uncultured Roseobacter sp.]|uniref:hypothetical protein n=1 Tax=uncultured Roseobacter sp. TaxID=114847 RepID=UPI0026385960|nr:hypothetical protein [uncultured Roseobacter sp.]
MNNIEVQNTEHLQLTNLRLKWLSRHDYSLAIFLVIASFAITPLATLFLPVVLLVYLMISFDGFGKETEQKIRKHANLSRRIFLRQSLSTDPWIFSIPYFSVLFLPKEFFEKTNSRTVEVVLRHELIHHKRHDGALLVWFIATSALLLFGSSLNVIALASESKELYNTVNTGHNISRADTFFWIALGVITCSAAPLALDKIGLVRLNTYAKKVLTEILIFAGGGSFSQWLLREYGFLSDMAAPLDSQASTEQLYQTSWFWTVSMVVLFGIALAMAFKVIHRTEFVADNLAAQENYQDSLAQLDQHQNSKIKYNAKNGLVKFFNFLAHPSNSERAKMLKNNSGQYTTYDFGYAFVWAFAAGLCILFAFFDGYSSWGSWAVVLADISAFLGCIIFLQCCAISISDILFANQTFSVLKSFLLTLTYILGFSASVALVLFVDYSAYPQEGLSLTVYIGIGVITGTVALILIFLSCLTLSLLKSKAVLIRLPALLAGPLAFLCGYTIHPDTIFSTNPTLAVLLMFGIASVSIVVISVFLIILFVVFRRASSIISSAF